MTADTRTIMAVCLLDGDASFIGRCRRCGEPMVERDADLIGYCPDCLEGLRRPPHPQRGIRRGPSHDR